MSGVQGLTLEGCCCSPIPSGCAGAVAMKDAILAVSLRAWGCNITGTMSAKLAYDSTSLNYIIPNPPDDGCHNIDCCLECGGPVFDCNNFCEPPSLKRVVTCVESHSSGSPRYFNVATANYYCPACEDPPTTPCLGCRGVADVVFESIGLDSRASVGSSLSACPTYGSTSYLVASRVENTTDGSATVTVTKRLTVRLTSTAQGYEYPACLLLQLDVTVVGVTDPTCSPADLVTQYVTYYSAWNGTDSLSVFLGRNMTLHSILWDYDICPSSHGSYGADVCGAYDIATFVDAICGVCTVTSHSIDYTYISYAPVRYAYACLPATQTPIIDSTWQPWTNIPTLVAPLL